jgi:hypothetical protein
MALSNGLLGAVWPVIACRVMAALRFGVVSESVRAGRAWLDFARQVEGSGIDVLLLRDHFSAGPFGQQLAPFSGLAAAAAVTTRLRLARWCCRTIKCEYSRVSLVGSLG